MIVVFDDEDGRILQCVNAPVGHAQYYGSNVMIVEDESITDMTHYIEGGGLVPFPLKPTEHHEWDWAAKAWAPNLHGAKSARKIAVDSERVIRTNYPLTYDGKLLDADQTARDNLKAKLEEVRERIRLGMAMPAELLVWRDANNDTHAWPTIEAYNDWLSGFAIAMSDRGTRLYGIAWAHKDAIQALTTVEEVMNYNIKEGWDG